MFATNILQERVNVYALIYCEPKVLIDLLLPHCSSPPSVLIDLLLPHCSSPPSKFGLHSCCNKYYVEKVNATMLCHTPMQ